MNVYLDYLLNLPGVSVSICTQVEGNISLSLEMLTNGISCPHCGKYTQQVHQNRPMLVRDLQALWSSSLSESTTPPILLPPVSAIQHRELRLYRLAKTTYATIRSANLSTGATIESVPDWARRRDEL